MAISTKIFFQVLTLAITVSFNIWAMQNLDWEKICSPDYCGYTQLHYAVHYGHTAEVKDILAAAPTPEQAWKLICQAENAGKTLLFIAAEAGHTEIAKIFLAAAPTSEQAREQIFLENDFGKAAWHCAVENYSCQKTEMAKIILDVLTTEQKRKIFNLLKEAFNLDDDHIEQIKGQVM